MIKVTKKALVSLVPALAALAFTTACGNTSGETSESKVTNGVRVNGSTYPSTVLLVILDAQGRESICTGTFVNDAQVVTAGHCVEGQPKARPRIILAKEANGEVTPVALAQGYARNPRYNHLEGVSSHDLAVINFPANSAPAISPIADASPAKGEPFTIVGYGNNENFMDSDGVLQGAGAGVKRAGVNRISLVENGMIEFVGVAGTVNIEGIQAGQYASSGAGDSGGPMFVGDKLVGVTSGGGLATTPDGLELAVSRYVDLNSEESKAFLKAVLKKPAPARSSSSSVRTGS